MGLLRRALAWSLKPVLRAIARWSKDDDPWERFPYRIPVSRFGRGSYRPFKWYFEGGSLIPIKTLDEICDWLLGCEYAHDDLLFNEADFWQHPRTFEHLRKGDCEDHAIWAWRKLVELDIEAELVSGDWQPPGNKPGGTCGCVSVTTTRSTFSRQLGTVASEWSDPSSKRRLSTSRISASIGHFSTTRTLDSCAR
jgi:hypothetical protein